MIQYGYHCPQCKQEYTSPVRAQLISTACRNGECKYPGPLKRKYSLAIHNGMKPHMNSTTQTEIRSQSQFDRELRQKSDELEDRTGMPHRFSTADPDQARAAVEESQGVGLDTTNTRRMREGKRPIRLDGKSVTVV